MENESNIIKKAVIPAAGLGLRFLPATKAQPKEMLPIVDKPTIQYVIEEAVASGIDDIVIVTGRGKRAIEDHFDKSFELEEILKSKGKLDILENIKNISSLVDKIHYVRQKEQVGLGDAILCAEKHIGNEPFVVLLGDVITENSYKTCTKQLMELYSKHKRPIIAVKGVERNKVNRYGIVKVKKIKDRFYSILDLIEKPKIKDAPSNLAIVGRYVLTPEIFDALKTTKPGYDGEIQLTDALKKLKRIYAYEFEGELYDTGNKIEWLKTMILFALKRDDIGSELRKELIKILKTS
jgi:UTP--glucose-1-phosphate uridylyltransferase